VQSPSSREEVTFPESIPTVHTSFAWPRLPATLLIESSKNGIVARLFGAGQRASGTVRRTLPPCTNKS
jgi:hypothetical protein